MRAPIVIAGIVIIGLAAGGGYYGLEVYPQRQFRQNLDQTLAALPPGTTESYRDAHYSVTSHTATINGLTIHAPAGPADPGPTDLTIDSLEATNPNLNFARALDEAAATTTPSETAIPAADTIIFKGVTVHANVLTLTTDSLRVDKLRTYGWTMMHDGLTAWKTVASSVHPTRPMTPEELLPVLRAEVILMSAVAYDGHGAQGMRVALNSPEVTLTYDIRSLTGGAFDRGVMAGGSIEGVTVKGGPIGAFTLDRAVMGAADFRAPLDRVRHGEDLSVALLDGIKVGRIDYTGITVTPPGQTATHVGGLSIGPLAFSQGKLASLAFGWSDFAITRAQLPDEKGREAFDNLGLDVMTTGFNAVYDWDPAGKQARLRDTTLTVKELGTLTLSLDMANLEPGIAGLMAAQLVHAKLNLRDASLTRRLLDIAAKRTGADPAVFRQQAPAIVQTQSKALGPALATAGQALGAFLAAPQSLTVELSPPAPVPVMALQAAAGTPALLATTLGLTVTANQP